MYPFINKFGADFARQERAVYAPVAFKKSSKQGSGHLRVFAAVDSLASCSTVSLAVSKKLGYAVTPPSPSEPQQITLAKKGVSIPRVGTTRIPISCGKHHRVHTFEVMDTDEEAILGLDIFPTLGIFVGGVPTSFADDEAGLSDAREARDGEAPLQQRASAWSLGDRVNAELYEKMMSALQTLLTENSNIDPSEVACASIPEAVMRLPTMPDPSARDTFRHQYAIPLAARPKVEQQLLLWDATGVTVPGSAASEYNTAIMAAGKKDLEGRKTDYRICLDFRHVNALLVKMGHATARMPHLQEVLQRMQGFTYATALDLKAGYSQLPIAPEDQHKTTFRYNGVARMFARWPFGLTPATPQFQKVMEIVCEGLPCVAIWVDDLTIFTKGGFDEHIAMVQ